jgi:hypothetical protein
MRGAYDRGGACEAMSARRADHHTLPPAPGAPVLPRITTVDK